MDEKFIFALIDKVSSSGLSAFEYRDGERLLILKNDSAAVHGVNRQVHAVSGNTADGQDSASEAEPDAPNASDAPDAPSQRRRAKAGGDAARDSGGTDPNADVITSPIVATFYSRSAPDSPPYVEVGKHVKKGETLCILEAMKMMNKLEAESDCEITAIRAASGELVEFGQVLFEVKQQT